MFVYCFILINEIIKANLTMIHYLLSPQILPEPALVRFHTDLKTRTAQVLLANSIIMTPGTITEEKQDGEYHIVMTRQCERVLIHLFLSLC